MMKGKTARSAPLRVVAAALLLVLAVSSTSVLGFYVPGAVEKSYKEGEDVPLMVNSLRSSAEMFPVSYVKMPLCQPNVTVMKQESIGELIWGDRMYNSLYTVPMKKNVTCMALPGCDSAAAGKAIRESKKRSLRKMIDQWYRAYMSIDNLPVFTSTPSDTLMTECAQKLNKDISLYAQRGYPLGLPAKCTKDSKALLNNHLDFTVYYNTDSKTSEATKEEEKAYIVVSIEVKARSVKWSGQDECSAKLETPPKEIEDTRRLTMEDVMKADTNVYFTYSVTWAPRDVRWATRWDYYLNSNAAAAPAGHILFIILSLMVVLFIGSAVMGVLLRALHKDFNRYNTQDAEDLQEEVGWKLVHADVFRPPFYAEWLAIFVANGCQILTTVGVVLVVAVMGFLSPSRRGALVSALLLTAIFSSIVGAYVCGMMLQYLNCKAWKHVFTCSLTLPGALLFLYLVILVINKAHDASTAVPFGTLVTVVMLFVAVSLPLTVLGSSLAFHQQPIANPTRVGRLAREIPTQSVINSPLFMFVFWPCVPLIVVMIELYYIMQDLWEGQIYYSFGFLTITAGIWVLVTALVTVSCLYYVLCYENHRWWWIAYLVPGGAGAHMFAVAIFFFISQLSVSSFASAVLFFLYMGMVSYMYGMAAGAVGVIVSIAFVRKIYSSIKID